MESIPGAGTPGRAARLALAAMAAVLTLAGVVWYLDLATFDADVVAARVRASGAMGPLALIALLVAQAVVAPLPSPPILIAAGFVYGPWVGFAIGWFGLLVGATACFALARAFGQTVAKWFVSPERLAAVEKYVTARSGATVMTLVSLRVFMPPAFDAVSYGSGLVHVPLHWFLVATALGEIPKVGSFTYIGAAAGGVPGWLTAWVLLAPALGVIGLRILRARRGRTRAGGS
jgi:uncharacterized membrane protein YdjX (TVP38/TMEM64 family)